MEAVEDKIARAQQIAQTGIEELVHEHEVRVLNKLVRAYTDGKLDDRQAAIGVSVIAELRRMAQKLDHELQQGVDATRSVTQ